MPGLELLGSALHVGHPRKIADEKVRVLIAARALQLCEHLRRLFLMASGAGDQNDLADQVLRTSRVLKK